MTSLLLLILASVPDVIVMDGSRCGASESQELVVRVRQKAGDAVFRATASAASIDGSGRMEISDFAERSVSGSGPLRLKLSSMSETESKLVKAGWLVLRQVSVFVGDKLVASVAVEVSHPGGRCLWVQL